MAKDNLSGIKIEGSVLSYKGGMLKAKLWPVKLYSVVSLKDSLGSKEQFLVSGFEQDVALLAPLTNASVISSSAKVQASFDQLKFNLTEAEKIFDCLGPLAADARVDDEISILSLDNQFSSKQALSDIFFTGIRSVDYFMPTARGQRVVVIGNAGSGKSTFLKYLLLRASFDVVVVGLIGERGREVVEILDFLEGSGVKNFKLIISTSSEPPIRRLLSAYSATSLASYYRERGLNVLLIIDSLTRVARAIREIGLQNGEVPFRQGLTPSVFSTLPTLLEVPGKTRAGSITAFYTLLTHESDDQDILAEEVKSLVDGHIILDRRLARRGVYPAVNILSSLSRVAERFLSAKRLKLVSQVKSYLSMLEADRELMYLSSTPPPHMLKAAELEKMVDRWATQQLCECSSPECLEEFDRELEIFLNEKRNQFSFGQIVSQDNYNFTKVSNR